MKLVLAEDIDKLGKAIKETLMSALMVTKVKKNYLDLISNGNCYKKCQLFFKNEHRIFDLPIQRLDLSFS